MSLPSKKILAFTPDNRPFFEAAYSGSLPASKVQDRWTGDPAIDGPPVQAAPLLAPQCQPVSTPAPAASL